MPPKTRAQSREEKSSGLEQTSQDRPTRSEAKKETPPEEDSIPSPMDIVDCVSSMIGATSTLVIHGSEVTTNVCGRGHKVYQGKRNFYESSLI